MKKLIIFLLKLYRIAITPILITLIGHGCKFEPNCSSYATEAIEKFGVKKGLKLASNRLLKCHPLDHSPHFDPVPNL